MGAYLFLLTDTYPSTVEEQSVHLEIDYPDVQKDLNRWLPLVKWLLAIPHYLVLVALGIGAVVVWVIAWFAILFTAPESTRTSLHQRLSAHARARWPQLDGIWA